MCLDILFRSCTRVASAHAGMRPCQASKRQVTLCCLKSLLDSCDDRVTVHVFDDHSVGEDVAAMRSLLAKHDARHTLTSLMQHGNGASLEAVFSYARDQQLPLVYFCEDDYLHLPEAIPMMLDFYERFNGDCIIHPTDYIDRYVRDKPYPSFIFLGADRHWRTIKHTTGTFMMSGAHIKKYWKNLQRFADWNKEGDAGGEDKTINRIYQKEVCVSPMPSLAAHFSPEPAMPHFVDWEMLFNSINNELRLV